MSEGGREGGRLVEENGAQSVCLGCGFFLKLDAHLPRTFGAPAEAWHLARECGGQGFRSLSVLAVHSLASGTRDLLPISYPASNHSQPKTVQHMNIYMRIHPCDIYTRTEEQS